MSSNSQPPTCQVPGCERPVYAQKHRLCKQHTRRYYATGQVGGPIAPRRWREPARVPAEEPRP